MKNEQWGFGAGSSHNNGEPFDMVVVEGRPYDLLFGEHPHSRSDNNIYARSEGGEIEAFDGHRICMRIEIEESNYLKESHYSGDEIRKGGSAKIFADGVQVYEFFHRDALYALIKAHGLIGRLHEAAGMSWTNKRERPKLVGRAVYYNGVPGRVTRLIEDQGCVIIEPEEGHEWRRPVWCDEDDEYDTRDPVKADVLGDGIWWHRREASQ